MKSSPPTGTARPSPSLHIAAGSVLALVAALLFASSFEAWGHPIIDLGRDLYLPSQLLEGRVLYRDLLYNYGPAAPYLLAAITAVLGDALWVFETVGLLLGLATLCGLYGIANRLGGVWIAFSSTLMFLVLSLFANSTWGCNFVLPYSFAATLGIAAALGSFYFLHRYLFEHRSPGMLVSSVTLLFVALLSKQEVGVAIAGVHVVAWWAHRISRRAILITLGSGMLIGILFLIGFSARDASEHALFSENLARFADGADTSGFFSGLAGIDRPIDNLLRSLLAACKLALVIALCGIGGWAFRPAARQRFISPGLAAIALVAGGALAWNWAEIRLFQAIPVYAVIALAFFLVKDRKDPLVLLTTFTLLTGLRVILQYHPMWYGFYLTAPGFILIAYLLAVRLPQWLPARTFDRRAMIAALVGMAIVLGWRFESKMLPSFKAKTSRLETAKGSLRDDPVGRAEAISEFLGFVETELASETATETTMVVMPEGVSLNYFTGFTNPTAYYLFTPIEIPTPDVESRMIQELEQTQPDYLVMTSRNVTEYGRRGIGLDYAMELGDWIRSHYDLVRLFEAGETESWRLLLLKRR